MMGALSRRSLVSAAPAAIVAASVPASACAHPDAALLALRPLWLRVFAAYDATFDPLAAAELLKAGVAAAEERQRVACEAAREVADQVFELRAQTAEGIRFKLQVLRDGGYAESDVPEFDASLRSDFLRLVEVRDA